MPELPEVECTRENLVNWVAGCRSINLTVLDPKLLPPASIAMLQRAFENGAWGEVRRRGKQLIWDFEDDYSLGVHLRMTGKFVLRESPAPSSAERASLSLDDGRRIAFEDQRRFAVWQWGEKRKVETDLGWDKLGPDALVELPPASHFFEICHRSGKCIRDLLLDQTLIAGVGNIVANESLYLAQVHPLTTGKDMSLANWESVLEGIQKTLQRSLERDRGREILYQGEKGADNPFLIYGKSGVPCPKCRMPIHGGKKSGRSCFHCPGCQPAL